MTTDLVSLSDECQRVLIAVAIGILDNYESVLMEPFHSCCGDSPAAVFRSRAERDIGILLKENESWIRELSKQFRCQN